MIRAGVLGATGYTGLELVRLLTAHPQVDIAFVTSETSAGSSLRSAHPAAPDLDLCSLAEAPLAEAEVIFACLPHAASAPAVERALGAGARVIDLSADFRLREPSTYRAWYGGAHPVPELLKSALYGLAEVVRDDLPAARLVANPGCYATSVLLALYPLVSAGAVSGTVIADAKSGVSGAGRVPKLHTHFVEVAEGFAPYAIGRKHRHLPEMEQALGDWTEDPPMLVFSPHLLPVTRGILTTLYVPLAAGWGLERARARFQEVYQGRPFLRLLPPGDLATLAHVTRTNTCALGFEEAAGLLIVTSALDNLVKGAAGQAVQNMNLMLGLREDAGLAA